MLTPVDDTRTSVIGKNLHTSHIYGIFLDKLSPYTYPARR